MMRNNMVQINAEDEYVVLVDEQDKEIGSEEKIRAHQLGLLHRAFSVFIYRKIGTEVEFLLQKRHFEKYHCGGLWTNTCCSHPRLNETVVMAAERRLKEEMSLTVPLKVIGSFIYRAPFDNGLIEHELDHVLWGESLGTEAVNYNPTEVEDCRWVTSNRLREDLLQEPKIYTPWLAPAFELVQEKLWELF
jgi:isopentenyl-diphosphate delta-isomerase type 1